MKILHLASFSGNTGDIINHLGFYEFLKTVTIESIEITPCEIRDYYKIRKKKAFDETFVKLVNKYDLLVVGGGNFLSPWIEDSETGTTFDIKIDLLRKIKVPILFNAVGCESSLGYSQNTISRLKNLFDEILFGANKERYLFTMRNDGSQQMIGQLFPKEYLENMLVVPDFGLYLNKADEKILSTNMEHSYIGIAFSDDRLNAKLLSNKEDFYKQFATALAELCDRDEKHKLLFIPHTYYDLKSIYELLKYLPDDLRREKTVVAPLITTQEGLDLVLDYYNHCKIVIGMRFHSVIQSLKYGIPVIAIYADNRLKALMEDLDLLDLALDINDNALIEQILKKSVMIFESNEEQIKDYLLNFNKVRARFSEHQNKLKLWFEIINNN